MSFIDRFKKRKTQEPYFTITYKDFDFKFERNSQEELTNCMLSARARCKKDGLVAEDNQEEFNSYLSLELFKLLEKHLIDWDHKVEEDKIKFSKRDVPAFLGSFDFVEIIELSTAYLLEIQKEEEAGEGNELVPNT